MSGQHSNSDGTSSHQNFVQLKNEKAFEFGRNSTSNSAGIRIRQEFDFEFDRNSTNKSVRTLNQSAKGVVNSRVRLRVKVILPVTCRGEAISVSTVLLRCQSARHDYPAYANS